MSDFSSKPASQADAPAADAQAPSLKTPRPFTPLNSVQQPPAAVDPALKAFFDDIEIVCRHHGLSLSHEDHQGGFIVMPFEEGLLRWLRAALDDRELGDKT
jgi:hypothetical protein